MKKLLTIIIFFIGVNIAYSNENKSTVDLNKPITNNELKKAIALNSRNNTKQSKAILVEELKKANFLVPIITDELYTEPVDEEGKTTVKKDSIIKIINTSTPDGKPVFAVFTDWDEIKAWTNQPVSTLVMPLSDVICMGLEQQYQGVVINPSGKFWYMDREILNNIKSDLEN